MIVVTSHTPINSNKIKKIKTTQNHPYPSASCWQPFSCEINWRECYATFWLPLWCRIFSKNLFHLVKYYTNLSHIPTCNTCVLTCISHHHFHYRFLCSTTGSRKSQTHHGDTLYEYDRMKYTKVVTRMEMWLAPPSLIPDESPQKYDEDWRQKRP